MKYHIYPKKSTALKDNFKYFNRFFFKFEKEGNNDFLILDHYTNLSLFII